MTKFLILFASTALSIALAIERTRATKVVQRENENTSGVQTLRSFRQNSVYKLGFTILQFVLGVATIGSAIVAFWGPFWPTEPKIEFRDNIDASSFVLPFKVTNQSIFFDLDDMKIICSIDLLYFRDANNVTGLVRDAQFNVGPITIKHDAFNNYPCRASDYVKIISDGSLVIGFEDGQSMRTAPNIYRGPLKIIKMCLQMVGSYKVLGRMKQFHSKMFQWPATPNGHQWIDGPITPDLPNEAWIPAGAIIGGVWALRRLVVADDYAPGVLQCSRI